jgi:nucleoside-triphosphatase
MKVKHAILLTGAPGSGKTTVIQRVLERLETPASGFYTREIRQGSGRGARLGFEIVTLEGMRGILAHVDYGGPHRVSKYGVDLEALDTIAIPAIRMGIETSRLVVIDEIGRMEILSQAFRQVVLEALEGPAPVLGSVVRRSTPFTDRIKGRPEVAVIEVTRDNRDALPGRIVSRLHRDK